MTEKRLELLKVIKDREPESIYALSKILGRNFKNVYTDLKILGQFGLIEMTRRKKSIELGVPYETITICMEV